MNQYESSKHSNKKELVHDFGTQVFGFLDGMLSSDPLFSQRNAIETLEMKLEQRMPYKNYSEDMSYDQYIKLKRKLIEKWEKDSGHKLIRMEDRVKQDRIDLKNYDEKRLKEYAEVEELERKGLLFKRSFKDFLTSLFSVKKQEEQAMIDAGVKKYVEDLRHEAHRINSRRNFEDSISNPKNKDYDSAQATAARAVLDFLNK